MDVDHTVGHVAPGKGGVPGQSRLGNYGPLVRFHHRIKTHCAAWERWLPAIITAVLAVAVPLVGPAVALFVCWKVSRAGRRTPQPTDLAPSI